jgi:hypothetical protein
VVLLDAVVQMIDLEGMGAFVGNRCEVSQETMTSWFVWFPSITTREPIHPCDCRKKRKNVSAMEMVAVEVVGPHLANAAGDFRAKIAAIFKWTENAGQ